MARQVKPEETVLEEAPTMEVGLYCPGCGELVTGLYDEMLDEIFIEGHAWVMGVDPVLDCPRSMTMIPSRHLGRVAVH